MKTSSWVQHEGNSKRPRLNNRDYSGKKTPYFPSQEMFKIKRTPRPFPWLKKEIGTKKQSTKKKQKKRGLIVGLRGNKAFYHRER